MKGWLLNPARALIDVPHSSFAVLQLVLSYFESCEILRRGEDSNRRSPEFFRGGFLDVFQGAMTAEPAEMPIPPDFKAQLANVLYKEARCGLFHNGVTRHRIVIGPGLAPIVVEYVLQGVDTTPQKWAITAIKIDPARWLSQVEAHFGDYIRRLRDSANVRDRDNFNKGWRSFTPLREQRGEVDYDAAGPRACWPLVHLDLDPPLLPESHGRAAGTARVDDHQAHLEPTATSGSPLRPTTPSASAWRRGTARRHRHRRRWARYSKGITTELGLRCTWRS